MTALRPLILGGCALAWACLGGAEPRSIQSAVLRVEFDATLKSRVVALGGGKATVLGPYTASETLEGAGPDFPVSAQHLTRVDDVFGPGERLVLEGQAGSLAKTVTVTIYDAFPEAAVFDVAYVNKGAQGLRVTGWRNNAYVLDAEPGARQPAFFSYQSGSSEKRRDWIRPLHKGNREDNYQGMNDSDYGGGTPVADVWGRHFGLAVGHLETGPRLVSLPVAMPDRTGATLGVRGGDARVLGPGQTLNTLRTFVTVHGGDCFQSLGLYQRMMARQGFHMAKSPESAFGPIWCAWGYGRSVVPSQVYGTLPMAKKMGFTWVTFDDGWQNNCGDWALDPKKFPGGDQDMKAIVDRIHKDGFLAQLWWCPLSAVASSKLLQDEPGLALLNEDGTRRKITWWDSFYLCPQLPRVKDYHAALVKKILVDWGFDGLKLDGQHMNAVPPCFNPEHHHARPEEAVEAVPDFFKAIFEAAKAAKPDALVEFCPCGTTFSFFTMPFYNMSVASDPSSSFQVRSKGKVLKALMGDGVAFFGDHVELTESHVDFASTIAVGGVAGTQFALPALVEKKGVFDLTPARERHFIKWLGIYRDKMLSKGTYLGGLYDIGFDLPEAHAVRKDGALYYGFFAKRWKGTVELRGLEDRDYHVRDYAEGRDLGTVHGPVATLKAAFRDHLLVEAKPF